MDINTVKNAYRKVGRELLEKARGIDAAEVQRVESGEAIEGFTEALKSALKQ